jgi:putative tryptophan/tyrosine transport system substrate-binding protein
MKIAASPSILVAVIVLAVAVVAEAQQPAKVPRIGYLSSSSDSASESTRFEAIRRALRELGYIEGQNIAVEYRYAEGNLDRAAQLAAELVRLKVDISEGVQGKPPKLSPAPHNRW